MQLPYSISELFTISWVSCEGDARGPGVLPLVLTSIPAFKGKAYYNTKCWDAAPLFPLWDSLSSWFLKYFAKATHAGGRCCLLSGERKFGGAGAAFLG